MHTLTLPFRASVAANRLPNTHKWMRHFERNRLHRPEPVWDAPIHLSATKLAALLPSLEQFQLGDGGGDCCLIAFNAGKFTGITPEIKRIVDRWFAEEAE